MQQWLIILCFIQLLFKLWYHYYKMIKNYSYQGIQLPQYEMGQQFSSQPVHSLYDQARNKFITKVYLVLLIQLLLTSMSVVLVYNYPVIREFQSEHQVILALCVIASLTIMFALICIKGASETYPINLVLLTIFTIFQSYMISFICTMYSPVNVLLAAGITASVTVGLTAYSIYSKSDFVQCWHGTIAFSWSLFFAAFFITFINFFIQDIPSINNLLAFCFAILYSIYLVVDTQMIIGNGKQFLSLDNWVLGSMLLYVDIIGLFLKILRILRKNDE